MAKKEESYTSEALLELKKLVGNDDISLQRMDGMDAIDVDVIPSGSISLDVALGVGGLPRGRVIEIYGPESSGKTTLTLSFIAQAQRLDETGWCLFVDAEHAMDPVYAQKLGVDLSRTVIIQPSSGEEGLSVVEKALLISKPPMLAVIDSVAALVPKSEIDYDLNSEKNNQPGRQGAMMSLALRKMTAIVAKSGCAVVFINQLRMQVGMVFGNPETQPGGKALKFYASVRLDIRRTGSVSTGKDETKEIYGNLVTVKVVKNKVAPPFKKADFTIIFGKGIDESEDLVKIGEKVGVITKEGSVYAFPELGITWKGKKELADLWDDELFQNGLRDAVRKALFEEAPEEGTASEIVAEALGATEEAE